MPATSLPDAIRIVGVYESVEFYPACGNETLQHLTRTWYPVASDPTNSGIRDEVAARLEAQREESPVVGRRGLLRVVEPGPGDDTGTLVIWADGVARWVSDSRDLDVWMVDDEITYNWVC